MSKKTKIMISRILSALLLLAIVLGNSTTNVYADQIQIINPNPEIIDLEPGETRKVKIPVTAVGADINNPQILLEAFDTPYIVSQPVLKTEGISNKINSIYRNINQYIEFDITVSETAKIGNYKLKLTIIGTVASVMEQEVTSEIVVHTRILKEKEPAQLTVNKVTYDNSIIGKDMNLSFTLQNVGEITARNVFVSIDYADTGMIAGYSTKNVKVEDIAKNQEVPVRLPIKILSSAKPGLKTLAVKLTYKLDDGNTITESHDIYITLRESENAPDLILEDFTYNKSVKPGEELGLTITLKNYGITTAINPRLSVDESSIGNSKFIKNFYTDYIELRKIKSNQSLKVEVPLSVAKDATGGLKELKLNLVYFDEEGVEYKTSVTIYPDIEAEGVTKDGTPVIVISNVQQSPERPEAGGNLTVSFDLENKSAKDLNDFKIGLKNISGSAFVPVDSDPYQYLGVLKAGTTKRITLNLTVSKNVQEGANTLSLAYSYTGGGDSIDIPVLNVANDLGSAKPKLIISQYSADQDILKAGSVFNFNFDVHNTHSSMAAKNIIITVLGKTPTSQAEIFSVTQGSNSFFVSKINPGETISKTLEMKIKSDAATMTYPIFVKIEYEYDGIEANPTTGEIGEKVEYELALQVVENARPFVDWVQIYSYDGNVIVNSPATLSFEFYNMGKSLLSNVRATVEGDFTRSGGEMYFLGSVNAGDRSYAEFEVIPIVEGNAKGVIKITYEDSNGDEQVFTKEFEYPIMGEQVWDPGMMDGGLDVFNPVLPEPKKAILPVWAFVLVQVALLAIFVPVSRKVIINIYKSKLRKKEEEMF